MAKILLSTLQLPAGPIGPEGPVGPPGEPGLDGANVLPTSEAVAQAVTEDGPAKEALSATFAWSDALETVPVYREGDSYDDGGQGAAQESRPFPRLAARYRMGAVTKASVAGTRMDEIATRVLTSFGTNRRGLVCLGGGILNDVFSGASVASPETTREALRTILGHASSRAVNARTTGAFFFGPNWSEGASSTAGAYVDVAFTAATAYLQVGFVTGSGGSLEIRDGGTLVATIATGGYKYAFTGSIRLTGSASVAKTYRVTLASGSATIVGLAVGSPTPPLIVWDQPGVIGRSAGEDTRILNYNAACDSILGDFPNVIRVAETAAVGWDKTTMISGDGIHRNDLGNLFVTNRIQAALGDTLSSPYQGLNWISNSSSGNAPAYTIPTPAYSAPGASSPSAPSAPAATPLDASATVSWERPADGGATITGWSLQYRVVGAGSWTTFGGAIAAGATSVNLTGLTASTDYQTRIAAINPVGTGSYSTATPFSTTAATVVYFADDFSRSDGSLGSTSTGSLAYQVVGGTVSVLTNRMSFDAVVSAIAGASATVNDGASDGTFQFRRLTSGAGNGGMLFRAAADSFTGYVLWQSGSNYRLSKRTSQGSYTTLASSSGITPAVGDLITVIAVGSNFTVKVNGVTAFTATDASYAGTYHGGWSQNASVFLDDFSHTDATV